MITRLFLKNKRKRFLLFCLIAAIFNFTSIQAQYTDTHFIGPSPWNYFNRFNELVVTTVSSTPVNVTIKSSDGTVIATGLTTVSGTPLRYRFSPLHASTNASNTILSGQGLIVTSSYPVGV